MSSRLVTLTRAKAHQQLTIDRSSGEYRVVLARTKKGYRELLYAFGPRLRVTVMEGDFVLWVDDGTSAVCGASTDVTEKEALAISAACGIPMPEPKPLVTGAPA